MRKSIVGLCIRYFGCRGVCTFLLPVCEAEMVKKEEQREKQVFPFSFISINS